MSAVRVSGSGRTDLIHPWEGLSKAACGPCKHVGVSLSGCGRNPVRVQEKAYGGQAEYPNERAVKRAPPDSVRGWLVAGKNSSAEMPVGQ